MKLGDFVSIHYSEYGGRAVAIVSGVKPGDLETITRPRIDEMRPLTDFKTGGRYLKDISSLAF